jgi:hypothetical protein
MGCAVFCAHPGGGLVSTADMELLENVVHVVLYRRHLDVEALGNLLVRESFVDQFDDFSLTKSELLFGAAGPRRGERGKAMEQHCGDAR